MSFPTKAISSSWMVAVVGRCTKVKNGQEIGSLASPRESTCVLEPSASSGIQRFKDACRIKQLSDHQRI